MGRTHVPVKPESPLQPRRSLAHPRHRRPLPRGNGRIRPPPPHLRPPARRPPHRDSGLRAARTVCRLRGGQSCMARIRASVGGSAFGRDASRARFSSSRFVHRIFALGTRLPLLLPFNAMANPRDHYTSIYPARGPVLPRGANDLTCPRAGRNEGNDHDRGRGRRRKHNATTGELS